MKFNEIRPFVRYAQKLTLDSTANYAFVCPCDNRLFFCVKGETVIQTQNGAHKMQKGSVLLLPAGQAYQIIAPETSVTLFGVNFDYTCFHADIKYPVSPIPVKLFSQKNIIESTVFTDTEELNSVLYLQKIHITDNALERLLSAYLKKVVFYETETSLLLSSVLIDCVRFSKYNALNKQDTTLNQIFDYIHANCEKRLTNTEIAKQFGYNPNYVSELFKITTGMTLHQYVTGVRIERAVDLLEHGEKSVGEIAEICGFYDVYHFSKAFKSIVGVAPTKYRKG